jgi:tetratricopeptide (TPR) repeat protein
MTEQTSGPASMTLEQVLGLIIHSHQQGDYALVRNLCEKVLAAVPAHPTALYFSGIAHAVQKDWVRARADLEQLQNGPGATDASAQALASVYAAQEDWQTLQHLAQALIEDAADMPAHWYWLGLAAQGAGKIEGASHAWRKAIALDPNFVEARVQLGHLYLSTGAGDAVAQYQRVLEAQPDRVEVINNLGLALQLKGDPGQAVEKFRKAIAVEPAYAAAYANLGAALHALGQAAEGDAAFAKAIEIDPELKTQVDGLRGHLPASSSQANQ